MSQPHTPGDEPSRHEAVPSRQEAELERLYRSVPDSNCKGLCQFSCGQVEPGRAERDRLDRAGFQFPDWSDSTPDPNEPCRHLIDGRCSVHPIRPMLCRLWGSTVVMPCRFGCVPTGGFLSPQRADELLRASGAVEPD